LVIVPVPIAPAQFVLIDPEIVTIEAGFC